MIVAGSEVVPREDEAASHGSQARTVVGNAESGATCVQRVDRRDGRITTLQPGICYP